MKKRLGSILLAFALTLSLLPWGALPARAEDDAPTGFKFGMDAVKDGDFVYFGKLGSKTPPWRVLSAAGEKLSTTSENLTPVSGEGQVLLLSQYVLGKTKFDDNSNAWAGSEAQKWCEDFYNNADVWQSAEKAAITATSASGGSVEYDYTEPALNAEHFFFLTKKEVTKALGLNSLYTIDIDSRQGTQWWLRTAREALQPAGWRACYVTDRGGIDICYIVDTWGARPAFNLDPACVLFVTAAEGAKPGSGGTFAPMPENTTNLWKLTLLDAGRSGFRVTKTPAKAGIGGRVRVGYSGARTGENEYVSALLLDADGAVLGYGSVPAAAESGTATFTLPNDLTPGNYTLKVFSEQRNGDHLNDYASEPVELPLAVAEETVFSGFIADGGVAYGCPYGNLVDSGVNTKWYASLNEATVPPGESDTCVWVDFHAENAITVNQYSLITGDDTTEYPWRNPRAWTLKAKRNPDDAWTTIAAVTDDHTLEAKNKETYTFPLMQTGTWQYFRFMAGGGSEFYGFQFQELMLEYDASPNNIANATVSGVQDCYPCTGKAVDVACTVTAADGTVLQKGTDYTESISPSPVLAIGDYTLTITGIGNYERSQIITFSVVAPSVVENGDTVWFGTKTGNETTTPIAWRVLSADGDHTLPVSDAKHVLLISKYLQGVTVFDGEEPYSDAWADSGAKEWCTGFYDNWPAGAEKAAIAATSATDEDWYADNGYISIYYVATPLDGEHFFFLSGREAGAYFTDDNDRKAYYREDDSLGSDWWLRSSFSGDIAGLIERGGQLGFDNVPCERGARPAFNLDRNSVLFLSAAAGGKSGIGAALAPLPANETHEWKLTLLDDSRTGFTATETSVTAEAGSAFSLSYSGARTGGNEHVSALLYDASGLSVGYGGSAPLNSGSGKVSFTLPISLAPGRYTLKVFNEQRNGDYMSDYASEPVEIELTVTPVRAEVSGDFTTGTLRATVDAPAGALLLAAGYDSAGRLADTATFTVEEGKTLYDTKWTRQSGYTYKLMLLAPDTFAPLCAAWDSRATA